MELVVGSMWKNGQGEMTSATLVNALDKSSGKNVMQTFDPTSERQNFPPTGQ